MMRSTTSEIFKVIENSLILLNISSVVFVLISYFCTVILEYLTRKQAFRDEQIRFARENGTLQTCDCCCDDALLDDEMIDCSNQHRYCQ